jgi:hypothetical protein
MKLPESARKLVESGSLAHLVTLNPDGSPQVTWPPGQVMRISVERIGGVGPWTS